MDPLTQGLLGSAVAQTGARKQDVKLATVIGFISGLLADADILIRSSSDSLLTIEYHRHFTHSVFFIPIGALVASIIFYPFLKKNLGFKRLYFYCLLGYCFSGALDLCTSYGTYWLWPLLDERLALHIIGIVDVFFTATLLIAVVWCFVKNKTKVAAIGLMICAMYLGLGFMQLHRATDVAEDLIASRGHEAKNLLVKPSPFTLFLWRSVYEYEDTYYVDAIHVSWKQKIYEGKSIKKFVITKTLPDLDLNSVLANDIKRFSKFSDGYVAASADNELLLGDVRYALLPNSINPLWGIEISPEQQTKHAQYRFYRRSNKEQRTVFYRMLSGHEIPD